MNQLEAPATPSQERRFTLPCGCVALTHEDVFEVQWCPHHSMLHGVIPCNFVTMSRPEERAYR
ncbi:MAG: hypothetical protein JO029_11100 [Candidatus Eremiobacteraeota bacterium]|nr:hypothetical protein [Candidatus Eremiobacteraeota bacterium]MBV8434814.1 hypothetical protein [Candidatus Eremiobacteraeota bacterium]MBV8721456.1 hypothetical protein [Candidatus Eremiobacteraeota bacterium]